MFVELTFIVPPPVPVPAGEIIRTPVLVTEIAALPFCDAIYTSGPELFPAPVMSTPVPVGIKGYAP